MPIQPTDPAISDYYHTLTAYQQRGVQHEMAVRHAFATLLDTTAKPVHWMLIQEYTLPNRKRIDGALLDEFRIPRGYWEAKDSDDDLEAEIAKKIALGYPLANTIFEDTQRGILYQNGQVVMVADLTKPTPLADLLTLFFAYTEPLIQEFHTAVATFQDRIPELAAALIQRIDEEHQTNRHFTAALARFTAICEEALNPNISMAAIKEMLVQHLLTERLFRTIFNNPDFTNRNVIAVEIEKVIQALTSRSFSRYDFLQQLDYFYKAIEAAASTISDFSEKQTFLNTVYERFFQGFSHKQADTYGIVYTPQEIVDFMCASVEEVLHQEFGKTLSSRGVTILDPCVGTGNFMVNIINRLSARSLHHKYAKELFCNEVMLLPYYIASLNIEHAYYERAGTYAPFDGLCFIDTLDIDNAQKSMFSEENTRRIQRERDTDIMIIIGNPPYNAGQVNENDNNKNRHYKRVDQRVRDTYAKDSQASNRNALSDPYVKFFRWATDRLNEQDGIICFVSNNGFLDGIAFDGFRNHLAQDFTRIYHFNLKGNARTSGERRRQEGGNIFRDMIRVGIGITLLVRSHRHTESAILYHSVGDYWKAQEKQDYLSSFQHIGEVPWQQLHPDPQHFWLTEGIKQEFETFLPMGTRKTKIAQELNVPAIFKMYSIGVQTSRDSWIYDFHPSQLSDKATRIIETYNAELSRWVRAGRPNDIDEFVLADDKYIKWSSRLKEYFRREIEATFNSKNIRHSLYRPFTRQYLYFDRMMTHRQAQFPVIFPTPATEDENVVICVSGLGSNKPFQCLVSKIIPCMDMVEKSQCFPFYTYDEDGNNRRENITDWALEQAQSRYGEGVCKWDIFHYTYAMLHHPIYRERYADNLRLELPRIPLLGDSEAWHTLVTLGKQLVDLHLHYEHVAEYPLEWRETRNVPWTWRVEQMRLTPDKDAVVVNDALTLAGIPLACFAYRLGNRSALEWVIDQYRVRIDPRSGITSDPNSEDDQEYIVRLVGRVVQVSVETIALVGQVAAVEL